MPMLLNRFGGWLNFPEYFFFWCYHGQNAVFNTMSYQNPKLDKIIDNARFAESKPLYDGMVKDMLQIAFDEVPRIPLFQPTMDVAMQKDVQGYMYWFHLQPDYRQLRRLPPRGRRQRPGRGSSATACSRPSEDRQP
jgi:peptide/nickel transport system substrate-binding protein